MRLISTTNTGKRIAVNQHHPGINEHRGSCLGLERTDRQYGAGQINQTQLTNPPPVKQGADKCLFRFDYLHIQDMS